MSHNDFPLRDHIISAKAATLILRGIIATGELPKPDEVERPPARVEQMPARELSVVPGVPDAAARTAVAADAKSTRPRRKAKTEDGAANPSAKKSRKT